MGLFIRTLYSDYYECWLLTKGRSEDLHTEMLGLCGSNGAKFYLTLKTLAPNTVGARINP